MNLIYMCVFHQESYIQLLKLLIHSISVKANIHPETTHILLYTSAAFQPLIEKELADYTSLPIRYILMEIDTLMKASCRKLNIFQYDQIHIYDKILYLDTDVLVNGDVNGLFRVDISPEKLYALEEGELVGDYWGGNFLTRPRQAPPQEPSRRASFTSAIASPCAPCLRQSWPIFKTMYTKRGITALSVWTSPFWYTMLFSKTNMIINL